MRTNTSVWVLLASLVLSVPGLARAADVAFFPVESTNLTPEDASAIGELLAHAYASVSRASVLSPMHTETTLASSQNHADAARKLGVSEYVRTNAIAAGRRIVVHASRYTSNGVLVYQDKMTCESIEDMTNVSDRMARSLYERVDDEAVRTRHNVTLAEARPKNRVRTEKVIGIKSGFHVPFAKKAEYSTHVSLQFNGRLEFERFFFEFGAGLILPTSFQDDWCDYDEPDCHENYGRIGGLTSELGASAFLNDGNVGFYVGGGVVPRLTLVNDVATVSVYGQLGLMFPRESSTRFFVDLRLTQAVTEQRLDNNWKRYPTEPTLHIGIGW